jgi:hypothetical protein
MLLINGLISSSRLQFLKEEIIIGHFEVHSGDLHVVVHIELERAEAEPGVCFLPVYFPGVEMPMIQSCVEVRRPDHDLSINVRIISAGIFFRVKGRLGISNPFGFHDCNAGIAFLPCICSFQKDPPTTPCCALWQIFGRGQHPVHTQRVKDTVPNIFTPGFPVHFSDHFSCSDENQVGIAITCPEIIGLRKLTRPSDEFLGIGFQMMSPLKVPSPTLWLRRVTLALIHGSSKREK